MKIKIVLKEDLEDGGFNVSCPALPGCHSQGETVEEAIQNIHDAIQGCMDALNDRTKSSEGRILEIAV
jgi:predicted RNase H-like HicB family nuclease